MSHTYIPGEDDKTGG